ncbi:MAG: Ldh family oxidoreductase [Gemmatimonadota bacterium]
MGNLPPESGIRVPAEAMRTLVAALFERAGTSPDSGATIADLLVKTDLRGVFSHGTRQAPGYVRLMLDGRVNPRPAIRVTRETAATRVLDGDGGMGHFPCKEGTEWAVGRALELGTAAVTTRNHFHFGAAGKYSRLAAERGCIGLAISSHRYPVDPAGNLRQALGGSPLSIAVPTGRQPPLVLDMASSLLPWDPDLFARLPWAFFKELGLGAVMQALGGILAGIYQPDFVPPASRWESNQGAFIAVYSVECFMPLAEFRREMDRYVGQVRRLKPYPGHDRAELPGGMEWLRERDYRRRGIPVGDDHRQSLERAAAELGVEAPFGQFEPTRFGGERSGRAA